MRSRWLWVMLVSALSVSYVPSFGDGPRAHAATAKWQLVEDDDGIEVWSLDIPGKDLPGFRGLMTVQAELEDVLAIVKDVKNHTKWMYNCDESRIVKRFDEQHALLYNRINSPWPVYDRDVVLDIGHRFTPQGNAVTFRFRNTDEGDVPVPRRVVRIPHLQGFFRLWRESPTRTHVLYQVELDIGGNVPDVLARHNARKLPFETLANLRELAEHAEHD